MVDTPYKKHPLLTIPTVTANRYQKASHPPLSALLRRGAAAILSGASPGLCVG
jgi:hypothetical protein